MDDFSTPPPPISSVEPSTTDVASPPLDSNPDPRSVRALAAGVVLGTVIAAANVYAALKIGYLDGGAVVAALLAYAAFVGLGLGKSYTPQENAVTQAVAAGAGVMAGVLGLAATMPALAKLGVEVSPLVIVIWGGVLGTAGLALAWLLRWRLLEHDALPFPTGIAVAQVINTAFTARNQAMARAGWLVGAIAVACVITWLRDRWALFPPAFALMATASAGLGYFGGWSVAISPLLAGTGMMMGLRGALSLGFGSVLGWTWLAPWAVSRGELTSPDVGVAISWLVWPGVALIVAGLAVGMVADTGVFLREWRSASRGLVSPRATDHQRRHNGVAWGLLALSCAALIAFGWLFFDLSPLVVAAMIICTLALGLAAARATGETDTAPVGAMSTLALVAFGSGANGPIQGVLAATMPNGLISKCAQVLWSLKTAKLVGCPPWAMVSAHGLGLVVGAIAAMASYLVVSDAHVLGSAQMPAPAVVSTYATALALQGGQAPLSELSWRLLGGAALVGLALSLLELRGASQGRLGSWSQWLPSPIAMAMGMLTPPSFGGAVALGALMVVLLQRTVPAWHERYAILVAAGLLTGESVMGIALAACAVAGL